MARFVEGRLGNIYAGQARSASAHHTALPAVLGTLFFPTLSPSLRNPVAGNTERHSIFGKNLPSTQTMAFLSTSFMASFDFADHSLSEVLQGF